MARSSCILISSIFSEDVQVTILEVSWSHHCLHNLERDLKEMQPTCKTWPKLLQIFKAVLELRKQSLQFILVFFHLVVCYQIFSKCIQFHSEIGKTRESF